MNDRIDDLVAAHQDDILRPPPHVVQQWHDTIESAATLERGNSPPPKSPWHPASVFLGMAIAATVALGIGIGYFLTDQDPTDFTQGVQVAETRPMITATPVSLSRGLQVLSRIVCLKAPLSMAIHQSSHAYSVLSSRYCCAWLPTISLRQMLKPCGLNSYSS